MDKQSNESLAQMTSKQRAIMITGLALKYRDELMDI